MRRLIVVLVTWREGNDHARCCESLLPKKVRNDIAACCCASVELCFACSFALHDSCACFVCVRHECFKERMSGIPKKGFCISTVPGSEPEGYYS